MISDADLVLATRQGDDEAFESLIRKYTRLVYARTLMSTRDVHEAEDLVQETFLRAYNKIGSLKDPAQFRAWVMMISRNLCTDRGRKKIPDPIADPETSSHDITPDHRLFQIEVRDRILDAIEQLPERAQEPLVLRYLEGFSLSRIQEVTGLGEGALKGLLTRSLSKLRGHLRPLYEEIHEQGGIHDTV